MATVTPGAALARPALPAGVTALDWLKAAALILVLADHVGYYWAETDWLRVPGRLAAPIFFLLIGLSSRRRVPWSWVAIGVGLTVLDAWGEDDPTDGTINILLNFALIRIALPWLEAAVGAALQGRAAWLVGTVSLLAALAPFTGEALEYGTNGWLWALAGVAMRLARDAPPTRIRLVPTLLTGAALVSLVVEVPQQDFDAVQAGLLAGLLAGLAVVLMRFRRDMPAWQPPAPVVPVVQLLGRHTLAFYAIQIVAFEALNHV